MVQTIKNKKLFDPEIRNLLKPAEYWGILEEQLIQIIQNTKTNHTKLIFQILENTKSFINYEKFMNVTN